MPDRVWDVEAERDPEHDEGVRPVPCEAEGKVEVRGSKSRSNGAGVWVVARSRLGGAGVRVDPDYAKVFASTDGRAWWWR